MNSGVCGGSTMAAGHEKVDGTRGGDRQQVTAGELGSAELGYVETEQRIKWAAWKLGSAKVSGNLDGRKTGQPVNWAAGNLTAEQLSNEETVQRINWAAGKQASTESGQRGNWAVWKLGSGETAMYRETGRRVN